MLLLRQIAASRTFAKSPRLTKFLEFICLWLFEGRAREINEQQIGIHVFGRSAAYSASDDSIVRSQARLLRQRLEEYFEHECPHSVLIVTIPKGGYVPVFEPREVVQGVAVQPKPNTEAVPAESLAAAPAATAPAQKRGPRRTLLLAGLTALAVAIGVVGFFLRPRSPRPGAAADALWSELFTTASPTLIVPSDDALVLFQDFTKSPVQLDEYLSGTYLSKANLPSVNGISLSAEWFASHQLTSSADLNLALRLARLPQAVKADVETRNARVLRIDDLKSRNVILIGGVAANPWVGLFKDRLNFDVNWDWKASEGYVVNKHPQSGESALYRDTVTDGARRSYGVLAFLPGIEGNGDALLFQGTGMAGTESAADFPFSLTEFRDFAQRIGATHDKMPYFEVLLETSSVGGNAPEARVVAYRIIRP
jgi:hypothetical protein